MAELRGSSKRKKTATTRRIPPRIRDDDPGSGVGGGEEGDGGGERRAIEEDATKELPNPAPLPKVEEVPLQSISREGLRERQQVRKI